VLTSGIILPSITGVNVNELLVRESFGESFLVEPWGKSKAAKLVFFIFPEGRVAALPDIGRLQASPGVSYLKLLIQPGQQLETPQSGAGRHGFGIFVGETPGEVDSVHSALLEQLRIRYA
jgi:hypothetical protein